MSDHRPYVSFETVLLATGNNTGIEVPVEQLNQLEAGKRPAVLVSLSGYDYQTTVGVMSGRSLIPVSAAIRKATGLKGGDAISVRLVLATSPRSVEIPGDFAAALATGPSTERFFAGLSNSVQRFHVDNINSAKSSDTRLRRIAKTVELFRAGKAR